MHYGLTMALLTSTAPVRPEGVLLPSTKVVRCPAQDCNLDRHLRRETRACVHGEVLSFEK
jgi:hypothetical protein